MGGALSRRLSSHDVLAKGRGVFDLNRPDRLSQVLDAIRPDLVVNAAAYTAVDRAEHEPEIAARVNADAPARMARWCARAGIPFLHFSTDYVFDGEGDRPWREQDQARPLSVYGRTKLTGEQAIQSEGGHFLIVRTSWVYAATGHNFLRSIVRLCQERDELQVVDDQFGAPTSAAVIADAVAEIIGGEPDSAREKFRLADGLLHLTASGYTSRHGFATTIVSGLRGRGIPLRVKTVTPIRTDDYPVAAQRPRNSRLDLVRLNSQFGIRPLNWEDALNLELDTLAAELKQQTR